MNARLVLVFARLPREESHTKPLVQRRGSPRHVEALYEKLFKRTLGVARSVGAAVRLATHGELPAHLAIPGLEVVQQVGATFAERLAAATRDAFADGFDEVVVIGGDTPTLDRAHLEGAFAALGGDRRAATSGSAQRAALGPACDGGYYLLALNAFVPSLFTDVPLGTSDTGRATMELLAREGFTIAQLPPLHDLDDEADVRRVASTPGSLRDDAARLLAEEPSTQRAFFTPPRRDLPAICARGPPRGLHF